MGSWVLAAFLSAAGVFTGLRWDPDSLWGISAIIALLAGLILCVVLANREVHALEREDAARQAATQDGSAPGAGVND
jgi:hypothetical protein